MSNTENSFYPTIDEVINNPQKKVILVLQRSLRSLLPLFALFTVASLILTILMIAFADEHGRVVFYGGIVISLRWLALIPFIIVLEIIRKYHNDLYVFGRHRVTHFHGRLSLRYSIPVVRYADIRAVMVKQSIIARILSYGNIEIGTAAQAGVEMTIIGVRKPWALARLIDDLGNYNRKLKEEQKIAEEEEKAEEEEIKKVLKRKKGLHKAAS
ncbi:MAG: PH domain-containing protein [Candidatus Dadabacteria bacterium]|nr:MAG: PH domain-containing protein [Candidatus Dadabacteria bacterium]